MTQVRLANLVGVAQSTISDMELGRGGSLSVDVWQRAFTALDRHLRFEPSRDTLDDVTDAGHLAIQNLVLRLGRTAGYAGSFELPSGRSDSRSANDAGLRDDRRRILVLAECWNVFGDIGGAARSTNRKAAEAEDLAAFSWGEAPHRVRSVWVVRATRRNREIVATYADVFAARFPGSSVGWVAALTKGTEPPDQAGLVWCDLRATRLYAWRRR